MSDFWDMGGYAFYVWGSYGFAAAVFAWNVVAPRVQRHAVRRRLRAAAGEPGSGA
jgi:heme exporter protein CcmD